MVAKSLVHSPEVVVLDEPTAGVDVELRQQLWSYLRELNKSGTTIVLTTHYLEEAEELCDRIAIINHGELIACDKKHALLAPLDNKELKVIFDQDLLSIPDSLSAWDCDLRAPRELIVRYQRGKTNVVKVFESLKETGLSINDITTKESDLEDVFLHLTSVRGNNKVGIK